MKCWICTRPFTSTDQTDVIWIKAKARVICRTHQAAIDTPTVHRSGSAIHPPTPAHNVKL